MMKDVKRSCFSHAQLESLCRTLAEANTGSQIQYLLQSLNIEDIDPQNTKWKRIIAGSSYFRQTIFMLF